MELIYVFWACSQGELGPINLEKAYGKVKSPDALFLCT